MSILVHFYLILYATNRSFIFKDKVIWCFKKILRKNKEDMLTVVLSVQFPSFYRISLLMENVYSTRLLSSLSANNILKYIFAIFWHIYKIRFIRVFLLKNTDTVLATDCQYNVRIFTYSFLSGNVEAILKENFGLHKYLWTSIIMSEMLDQ